jgi:hypothetical protein
MNLEDIIKKAKKQKMIVKADSGERYYELIHPVDHSIMTIHTQTIIDIVNGNFDIDTITKDSLFQLVEVMSTVLLEFDDEAEALGLFVEVH